MQKIRKEAQNARSRVEKERAGSSAEDYRVFIWDHTSTPAAYEQLAEECVELAHACLKYARLMRGENPTAASMEDALSRVVSEAQDVFAVMDVIGVKRYQSAIDGRIKQWCDRLRDNTNDKIKA